MDQFLSNYKTPLRNLFFLIDAFGPSLWVGTSQGSAVALALRIPGNNNNEMRMEQQVAALPSGKFLFFFE